MIARQDQCNCFFHNQGMDGNDRQNTSWVENAAWMEL